MSAVICSPAIRRLQFGCRWILSPGSPEMTSPYIHQPDPTVTQPALPSLPSSSASGWAPWQRTCKRRAYADGKGRAVTSDPQDALSKPKMFESASGITRTAMCARPRGGKLYSSCPPPTERLEDYLEVVTAVEATAEAMGLPVILEGYEPPRDARITVLRVTPDPGVIEVSGPAPPAPGMS